MLAAHFLMNASLVQPSVMLALLWGIPPQELFGYPHVYPFVFAPAFLWAFARACPRVHRRTRLDDLARRMVSVSVAAGCALWVALVASLELARAGWVEPALFWAVFDASHAVRGLLVLGAVVVVVLRAPTAPAEEARRFALLGIGMLLWTGLVAADNVAEAFSPGDWLSNYQWSPAIVAIELLRFPGIALLWYSVLAARVPHPREVVRDFYTRLLARGRLLGVFAVVPAVALGWLVASRPERSVGVVLADPLVQSLAAAAAALLLVATGRRRLLVRFDLWIHPETTDQRETLAAATAALAQAGRIENVRRTVTRTVRRGCGSPAVLLVATRRETEVQDFGAPDAGLAPLARASAVVHMLETAGGSLRVHPSDKTSHFGLLPPDDAAWVVETEADVVVPVPGPGAELLGVVVVGRRFDDRIVREVDVPFLEALAGAAGLAVARLHVAEETGGRPLDAPAAQECPVCRCLTAAGEPAGCDCGLAYVETEVPKLLSGKFRLARRLGSGGMGAAWLARDLRLERDVAVKTLTGVSVSRLMGLKPEAWAMATVTHPAIAQIHGIESWRGRPFLVVEFLPGGTLEDKLRRGPLPAPRAVSVTTPLADALAALHEAAVSARRRQAEQHRVHAERVAEAAGLRSGSRAERRRHAGRDAALSVAGGALGPAGRGSRRRLVLVRGAARDGGGRAPVRRRRHRRGGEPYPAPAPRPQCLAGGGHRVVVGRGRVHGVAADRVPGGAAGRPRGRSPTRSPGFSPEAPEVAILRPACSGLCFPDVWIKWLESCGAPKSTAGSDNRDGRRPADGWHDDAVPGLVRPVRFASRRCRLGGPRRAGRGAGPARRRRLDAMERCADAGCRVPREPARCRSAREAAPMTHARPVRACTLEWPPERLAAGTITRCA